MILRVIISAMLVCLVVNLSWGAHFYTTDPKGEIAATNGYEQEAIVAYVFTTKQPNSIPVYRWFHPRVRDHLYTTDFKGEIAPSEGYVQDKLQDKPLVAFYCYPTAQPGTVPFYRWYSSKYTDHFYTTYKNGSDDPLFKQVYKSEQSLCYVFPPCYVPR